jgi:hypothetical protein
LVEEVVSDDDGFEEVLDEDGAVKVDEFGVFHGFQLVGHGKVASENCGTYRSTMGCLNREGHGFVSLDGKDYHGKGFFRPFHVWCGRPSCPTCFKHGWAVRLAKNGEARLLVFAKKHGQIEHVVVSVPPADYGVVLCFTGLDITRGLRLCGRLFRLVGIGLRIFMFWAFCLMVMGTVGIVSIRVWIVCVAQGLRVGLDIYGKMTVIS